MKWPELVPDSVCTIQLKSSSKMELTRTEAEKAVLFEGNFQLLENSKQVLDQERRLVQLQATALLA